MLKFTAITRQIKFLKSARQQYAPIRLFNGGVPRVLITGLFISRFVQRLSICHINIRVLCCSFKHIIQLLDETEQNIVIYQWRADQLFARCRRQRQIIDLRATDESRYFAIAEFNNCFIIYRLI